MAASVSNVVRKQVPGAQRMAVKRVVADDSYPEGGYDVSAGVLGFHSVHAVIVSSVADPDGLYVGAYDPENEKLLVFEGADGAPLSEVADQTDLEGVAFDLLVIGH